MLDVIGIGNLNYDIVMPVERFPEFHEKLSVDDASFGLGGSAANTVSWLSRMEVKTGYLGAVGDDPIGKAHLNYFKNHGIDTKGIKVVEDRSTGIAVILVKVEDKRMVKSKGANSDKKLDFDYLAQTRHIHLSSNSPELVIKAVKFADKNRITISLDTGEAGLPREIEEKVDYLLMNENEFKRKFGDLTLKKAESRNIIVSLNGGGALINNKEGEEIEIEGFHAEEVVDTTGAGDALNAGLIYGILNNWDLKESVRFGTFLAYLNVKKVGARNAIIPLKDIKEKLKDVDKELCSLMG